MSSGSVRLAVLNRPPAPLGCENTRTGQIIRSALVLSSGHGSRASNRRRRWGDIGFDEPEIDALLLEVVDEDAHGAEDEEAAFPTGPPVSRHRDIWVLGRHRLLQGDARDLAIYVLLMAPGERARMVFTDVPFNVAIRGHVTSGAAHREFAMASGEMRATPSRLLERPLWVGCCHSRRPVRGRYTWISTRCRPTDPRRL